ncbi:hypothetical protein [Stackebrandtia soli]|uniref:hypothetical protein n=1 Tax=Stackebrandtia soli TaxID=1892856 RepID=UPI0039E7E140
MNWRSISTVVGAHPGQRCQACQREALRLPGVEIPVHRAVWTTLAPTGERLYACHLHAGGAR